MYGDELRHIQDFTEEDHPGIVLKTNAGSMETVGQTVEKPWKNMEKPWKTMDKLWKKTWKNHENDGENQSENQTKDQDKITIYFLEDTWTIVLHRIYLNVLGKP